MAWIGDWLMAVALVAALGGASALVAWLLRWSGAPGGVQGAAVCAGVFVGLVAGPGVAANAWPRIYAGLVRGGVQQEEDLTLLREQQRDEAAALRATGVTPAAIDELAAAHEAELVPLREALDRARAERGAWNDRGLVAVCAAVVAVGVACLKRGAARVRRRGVLAGLIVFAAGVLLPWGALTLLGLGDAGPLALAVGAVGAGVGVAGLALGAGVVGSVALGAAALWVFGGASVPVLLAALIAMMARTVVPKYLWRRVRRWALDFLWLLGAPTLGALLAVRLDLRALDVASLGLWMTLIFALIWCSDGRMGAAWLALRSVRDRRAWAGSARMVNAGAVVPHLAFTGLGAGTGMLDQPTLAACAASAVLLSLTVGARRLIAEMFQGVGPTP